MMFGGQDQLFAFKRIWIIDFFFLLLCAMYNGSALSGIGGIYYSTWYHQCWTFKKALGFRPPPQQWTPLAENVTLIKSRMQNKMIQRNKIYISHCPFHKSNCGQESIILILVPSQMKEEREREGHTSAARLSARNLTRCAIMESGEKTATMRLN